MKFIEKTTKFLTNMVKYKKIKGGRAYGNIGFKNYGKNGNKRKYHSCIRQF